MLALQTLLEGYAALAEERPMAFVLCGNFAQKGWEGEGGLKRYTSEQASSSEALLTEADGFNALADLISSFSLLAQSHFVFVPGPTDPWSSTALPRPALPSAFTARIQSKIPKAHFVSNPCRIKYFGQEIVVCREDLMARMMRNLVAVKEGQEVDMKRYVSLDSFAQTPETDLFSWCKQSSIRPTYRLSRCLFGPHCGSTITRSACIRCRPPSCLQTGTSGTS